MPGLLWWWVGPFLLAVLGTPVALAYARRRRMLDEPGERRSHAVATPRGGGVAIVIAMLSTLVPVLLVWPAQWPLLSALIAGTLVVATAGWIDDHRPTSPWWRLSMHVLAGVLLAAGAWYQGEGVSLAVLALLLAIPLINIWNFMDGIDGIATTQAGIAALSVSVLGSGPVQALGVALLGACCGFLPFNAPRARIFLGDVGSGALGFLVAGLMVLMASTDADAAPRWWLLALPMAAFLVDASFTLLRRMVAGERWWEAHVQHVYQRMAKAQGAHMPVTFAYLGWALAGFVMLLATGAASIPVALGTIASWLAISALFWLLLRRRYVTCGESAA